MNKIAKFALLSALALPLHFSQAQVINEVYGGGGNAGAPFNQDFVEIFNNGLTAVDVGGFSLQYASATGTFTTFATIPAGTLLAAGQYYLVSVGPASTTIGAPLPNVNQVGSTGTNLSATAGRVQLLSIALTTVDLVGYGATAATFEGLGPAPAPSNTMSISRTAGIDTNNNNLDFTVTIPTPIPEPSTYMLLGVGLLACAQRFFRKRNNG
jgi:hypothetical protein